MSSSFVGVAGLPRSGSTLLCQLLAHHPDIYCEGRSSPLCNTLIAIRRAVSGDPFFLAQLDQSFDSSYAHLASAMRGYLRGWYGRCDALTIVDKNRAWLRVIELLLQIEPDAKLVVCLRDLSQIYGSIEAQHQRTLLVDFVDPLADLDRFGRADLLFAKDKAIGTPLTSLQAVTDLPKAVQERLYYLRYEDLMDRPADCLAHLYAWLGVRAHTVDLENLKPGVAESDSHYHMKFAHRQWSRIAPPVIHQIPPRIEAMIKAAYPWYYQTFYPAATARS